MAFKEARTQLIEALRSGSYQHEAREAQEEKNLLAIGDIQPEEVIEILKACRGTGYKSDTHHTVRSITVHVFKGKKVIRNHREWYVKAYFLGEDAWFISVHPA